MDSDLRNGYFSMEDVKVKERKMGLNWHFFGGITRRRWAAFILAWLTILILFLFLYVNARRSVINEIRHQAQGIAVAVAEGLDPADLEPVRGPGDIGSPPYRRIQAYLGRVVTDNPDVRYIYTMRRPDPGRPDYAYAVDGPENDLNRDGLISRSEMSERPGTPYPSRHLPALVHAWFGPGADDDVSPDPPYPDLMSGYAPVRDAGGQTVAIVGVDITAATVRAKLLTLRVVIAAVWMVISLLLLLVVQLYYHQQDALERNRALASELASRNEMLRAANAQLAQNNEQFVREMKLAQTVQLGFLPKTFPRQDKIIFDRFYLTCEMLGGDLFDVFTLDEHHVGLYIADVAGHGVSAALISGLLKMAVNSVRDRGAIGSGHLHASLLQPEKVLSTLNDMLQKELPPYEFITMIYAVLDIPRHVFRVASAGHLSPLKAGGAEGVTNWDIPTGTALGLLEGVEYEAVERRVVPGDKLLFFTDGLIEAMNEQGEEFGADHLARLFHQTSGDSPAGLIESIRKAVESHRRGHKISDDYSILVAEIR